MNELNNLYPKFKMLNPLAIKATLVTKVASLSKEVTLQGLYELRKKFPQFKTLDYKKDKEEFILTNEEVNKKKEQFFRIIEYRAFEYSCGIDLNIDFKNELFNIIDTAEKAFNINTFNIELIDIQYILTSEWEGNHYKVILDTFFKNSPLNLLFKPDNILDNSFLIRGFLDNNTRCVVKIESDINDDEIINKSFKNDTLKISLGIAQTGSIPLDVKLPELYLQHYNIVIQYIIDNFIPNILIPLDDVLAKAALNKR